MEITQNEDKRNDKGGNCYIMKGKERKSSERYE